MSTYGYLSCNDCRQSLWLGKALHRDGRPECFHRGGEGDPPHWQREQLNQVLWKFLADHTGHRIDVRLEHEMSVNAWDYQEIGGDSTEDIDADTYLADWPGLAAGNMAKTACLARNVIEARSALELALADKRRWPEAEFSRLFDAARAYALATEHNEIVHRSVASAISGLREYLEVTCKRVPGGALARADRLETMLFAGYDPEFDGHEPPGL